jgi:hypothetical protein
MQDKIKGDAYASPFLFCILYAIFKASFVGARRFRMYASLIDPPGIIISFPERVFFIAYSAVLYELRPLRANETPATELNSVSTGPGQRTLILTLLFFFSI